MSTIQQIRNFIRHGKHARAVDEQPRKDDQDQPRAAHDATGASEPVLVNPPVAPAPPPQTLPDAFSAPGAGAQNRVAQAGNVAARKAEVHQQVPAAGVPAAKGNKRNPVDDAQLARIVAEENESRARFPQYPGLERWQLLAKMGDGAFSNVYRARDLTGDSSEVAIKVVRKFEMNSMQRANILKEVQIMRQIDHPNVVKLVDFSESRQYYYIILELAQGGELFHQIVRLTYFSEDLSRHVITQVATALEYLHEERGIVHRDIKPENILFNPAPFIPSKQPKPRQPGDEDKADEGEFVPGIGAGGIGQIKIADFGLSKIVWDKQTMTPCGTVGYTAPEIVKDERYSKSVDMWALGCVLYTLLCGFPPFYDESIEVLTEKVARGQYTFLSPWWDDISRSAQDLISHLLTVDPDKRYTIREFLAHPWIRASGPTPREERASASAADSLLRPFDSARMTDGERRYDFRSPGAVNLREVFDVSYAVHRQEEEAQRRKRVGAGTKVGGPPPARLAGLNESEEDEEMADVAPAPAAGDGDVEMKESHSTQALEQRMRDANLRDGGDSRARERGRQPERAPPADTAQYQQQQQQQQQQQAQQQRGYGQHSAAVTAAARQQVRDRNRQKGAFELNLDGATLLGRRGMKPTPPVA